ncbi:SusD/RagB family nutrient-binding outer membrane lipoprotein [Emticicia sp. 21SJ11W-3]|uniref:SusD/RagB family nutrient-binding outer membrane lipoprotein n=1 Tax=Emticicia sp. 21SJ11W-3 TaxID=2916755 RepID=UPI00209EF062|nr:SusD/RagB family nutrient-binding outer membrane lipoprotein [Emticicia sp. 21SJ11W-3]UTA68661.1 SusD/RagB family nutrient-binding outer membrane lipoprotein [Emticicia sp. 21SJ11W-3]
MKKFIYTITTIFAALVVSSCDKGFAVINTNPYALTKIDPAILFTNAQRNTDAGSWEGEQTIVQQFVNAYNTGATAGFNFNEDNNNFNIPRWNNSYPGPLKLLEQIISLTKTDATKANLYQMARIWKSHIYIVLVDTYGDIPYSQAGKGNLEGLFYPKYDEDKVIYDELYNEIKSAVAALDASKGAVKEDLFFGKLAAAEQIDKWKKLGNSLLLRLGMRYSKIDQNKAKSIVQEAYKGGLIQTNADNPYIVYNAIYNNPLNAGPRGTNPYFYYLAEPFVNQLKSTYDPRLKYISGKYADPNQVLALTPDTTRANQFGYPIGYDQLTIVKNPAYRGPQGTGHNYSQLNYSVFGSATAPIFYVTNAQTKLLLAEASQRGWLTGLSNVLTTKEYYEAGVIASMDEYSLYPNVPNPAFPAALKLSYLENPLVKFSEAKALELINTQYWIASLGNGAESFANFRRSGFPALSPNNYNNNLQGGFTRRFGYPDAESSTNNENYQKAASRIGGDKLTSRVFWDK